MMFYQDEMQLINSVSHWWILPALFYCHQKESESVDFWNFTLYIPWKWNRKRRGCSPFFSACLQGNEDAASSASGHILHEKPKVRRPFWSKRPCRKLKALKEHAALRNTFPFSQAAVLPPGCPAGDEQVLLQKCVNQPQNRSKRWKKEDWRVAQRGRNHSSKHTHSGWKSYMKVINVIIWRNVKHGGGSIMVWVFYSVLQEPLAHVKKQIDDSRKEIRT